MMLWGMGGKAEMINNDTETTARPARTIIGETFKTFDNVKVPRMSDAPNRGRHVDPRESRRLQLFGEILEIGLYARI